MPSFGLDLVVYARSAGALAHDPLGLPAGVAWSMLDRDALDALFADDAARRGSFAMFLRQGFRGVALHEGGRWQSYIWTATPDTRAPLHLPASLRGRTWLISGHTRPECRNRGYLKLVIRLLARQLVAQGARPAEAVYADALASNQPSRRSLESMGFAPCGTLQTLRVPRTTWVWGRWHPERAHPASRVKEGSWDAS